MHQLCVTWTETEELFSCFSNIAGCISCLFGTLWSSKEDVRLVWDNTSLATFSKSPDNASIRPDMIFSTKLACGKCEVDKTRVRVLETVKRQLHLRLKTTSAAHKHVTFGILIYGFSFDFYVVRFMDGFYPYEKIS